MNDDQYVFGKIDNVLFGVPGGQQLGKIAASNNDIAILDGK